MESFKNFLKSRNFLYILLTVSLAFNVIIIGGVAYKSASFHAAMRGGGGDWVDKRIMRTEKHLMRFLENDADKELARAAFERRRPEVRAAFTEMREARRDLSRALRDEGQSSENLVAAINRSQAAMTTVNDNFHGLLSELAVGLSAESRAKIAKHILRHHRHKDRDRRDRRRERE